MKSNIGHLELAAGVAGLIKVLLQLQHKTLVKSLHCEELNPYIQLEGSPFYIVRETQAWQALQDAQGRDLPRRAGVSSFGFGGVNAHVVIEEYVPRADAARGVCVSGSRPALVVLSAKNAERLQQQVEQLVDAIEQRPLGDDDLADVAYTLQVGREAMECRLACVVEALPQLCGRLRAWLNGDEAVEDLYQGQARQHKDALQLFAGDELEETIGKWIERGKLGKLADLWVKGLPFDWQLLYGEAKPRRISLPTYPFARERYWVEASAADTTAAGRAAKRSSEVVRRYQGGRADLKGLSVAQCVSFELTGHVSALLKLPRERLDAEENLADFGLDSIGLAELARRLRQHFAVELSPSVFFSHPTLARLTQYFVEAAPGRRQGAVRARRSRRFRKPCDCYGRPPDRSPAVAAPARRHSRHSRIGRAGADRDHRDERTLSEGADGGGDVADT